MNEYKKEKQIKEGQSAVYYFDYNALKLILTVEAAFTTITQMK